MLMRKGKVEVWFGNKTVYVIVNDGSITNVSGNEGIPMTNERKDKFIEALNKNGYERGEQKEPYYYGR